MPKKATTKKREGIIVRAGVQKVEINDAKDMGLKWDKPSAVMTGSRKVKSASGGQEEESAASPRRVLKTPRASRAKADAPAAQTIGFGRGGGSGTSRSRRQPRIATAASGPTSRAEPKVSNRSGGGRKRATAAR